MSREELVANLGLVIIQKGFNKEFIKGIRYLKDMGFKGIVSQESCVWRLCVAEQLVAIGMGLAC